MNALYVWLRSNGRDEDVWKATSDPDYREKLLEEYDAEHGITKPDEE